MITARTYSNSSQDLMLEESIEVTKRSSSAIKSLSDLEEGIGSI
jgi:hypothetical protein